ncbi:MAG: serine/threonine protein kinase, partial [Planctomycetota bacterium]
MTKFEDDLSFGRLAVRMGYCSETQLKVGLTEQRRREIDGAYNHIGTILVEEGVLSENQLESILKKQEQLKEKMHIPGYEIISEIGRGAMGIVFRARQLSLDREVALKLIPKGVKVDREFRDRFLREAKSAAKLSHPNIIKAIDAGESGQYYYFAMELFSAPDLLDLLKEKGTLDEKELISIAIQLAKALQEAHEHQLVHRDIKPENILYVNGLAKLTDMGLARSTSPDEKKLTRTGATLGTPYYMSPEAVKGQTDIGIQADFYSLGATLYHLGTGRVPFEAENAFLVLRMHLDTPLVPPKHIRPELSESLSRIISKMMRKEPKKRFKDPSELLGELVRLRDHGPEKLKPPKPRTIAVKRPPSRLPLVAVSLLALVALVAAVGFFVLQDNSGGDEKNGEETANREDERPDGKAPSTEPSIEEPEPPELVEKKTTPPQTKKTITGEEAFRQAQAYAEANPEKAAAIADMYEKIGREFPDYRNLADKETAAWRTKAQETGLRKMDREVEALLAKKKYGPAMRVLHVFPIENKVTPDVEMEIKRRCDEVLIRAKSDAKMKERVARSKFASGDVDGAVSLLEEVVAFEIVALKARAKQLIDEFRKKGVRSESYRAHADVLANVDRFGLEDAKKRLEKDPRVSAEEKRNLKMA